MVALCPTLPFLSVHLDLFLWSLSVSDLGNTTTVSPVLRPAWKIFTSSLCIEESSQSSQLLITSMNNHVVGQQLISITHHTGRLDNDRKKDVP